LLDTTDDRIVWAERFDVPMDAIFEIQDERLYLKAMRLNPFGYMWYYPYDAIALYCQHRYDAFLELAWKAPLTDVWVGPPAFLAIACYHKDRRREAARYLAIFVV
jgi:hypothetical protein